MPKSELFLTADNSSHEWPTSPIVFNYSNDLPFPLSLPYHLRVIFGTYQIAIILGGLICRRIILRYISAPETKTNAINSLIWFEQLNAAIFGSFNLILAAVLLIFKTPLRAEFGNNFCNWIPLAGCINLSGGYIWSCLIAIYRILYIRAQQWVKYKIGERRLLTGFIYIGFVLQLMLSLTIFYFDDESLVGKACNHYSADDLEIMLQYKVSDAFRTS